MRSAGGEGFSGTSPHPIKYGHVPRFLPTIDDTIVEIFERIEITADGGDWEREGLRAPPPPGSNLVNDNLRRNIFLTLANRASFGMWAVLLC